MPTRPYDPKATKALPLEYGGKWVAWNADHTRVLASGNDLKELADAVRDQNVSNPIFEKVPRADSLFVGKS